jgi:alcohol/geraniol dehydrogenase (NADP+)
VGSIVGGRRFTSEMLEFAALHNIKPMVELLPLSKVNEAFERVLSNKPRYRIVLKPDDLLA